MYRPKFRTSYPAPISAQVGLAGLLLVLAGLGFFLCLLDGQRVHDEKRRGRHVQRYVFILQKPHHLHQILGSVLRARTLLVPGEERTCVQRRTCCTEPSFPP